MNPVKYFIGLFLLLLPISSLAEDITLSGNIFINSKQIFQNQKINILPGTKIGINKDLEEGLYLENCEINFNGTPENPIIIEGIGNSENIEEKNLIHIEKSTAIIKNTIFFNGSWHLHIHNSEVKIENSIFEKSYGGIRFTGENISIKRNIFKENKIATRFIKANPLIEKNIFYGNDIAIFLREGIKGAIINNNAFIKNNYDLYGGFFQEDDIKVIGNYFLEEPKILDKKRDNSLNFNIDPIDNLKSFPDWH